MVAPPATAASTAAKREASSSAFVAGSSAGRGSVPSYPAVEAAVRALARVVEFREDAATHNGSDVKLSFCGQTKGTAGTNSLRSAGNNCDFIV